MDESLQHLLRILAPRARIARDEPPINGLLASVKLDWHDLATLALGASFLGLKPTPLAENRRTPESLFALFPLSHAIPRIQLP
jgi:hypothetical protein